MENLSTVPRGDIAALMAHEAAPRLGGPQTEALGAMALGSGEEPQAAAAEGRDTKRVRTPEDIEKLTAVFSPLPELTHEADEPTDESEPDRFDRLWTMTDEESKAMSEEYLEGKQSSTESKRWPVTEATRTAAKSRLREAFRDIENGVSEVLKPFYTKEEMQVDDPWGKLVDDIRTRKDVRVALGIHLMDRIEDLREQGVRFPDRVETNGGKATTREVSTVSSVKSREYVALLALAKLDGTFDEASMRSTDRPDGKGNIDRQGQHGQAADIVLSDGSRYLPFAA